MLIGKPFVIDGVSRVCPLSVQMLKFSSGKTGHEDVKLLMEASALVPASQHWRHPAQPMEIDHK